MKKFIMVATLVVAATVAASASAATFVYTGGLIRVGSQGTVVYNLQECLADLGNNPYTNIDGIFGPITKQSVKNFQAAHNADTGEMILVDGIIGPVTGPLYTIACADTAGDFPEGCTSFEGYSTTTGESCDSEGGDVWEESDDEGQLISFEEDAPEESTVDEGEEKGVLNISFEADDADQLITRVDVDFQAADSTESDKPWDYMDKVSILLDGEEVASIEAGSLSDWDKTDATPDIYSIRFSGLELMVKNEEEVQLEVVVSALTNIDGSDEGQSWEVEIPTGGIRALSPNGYSETYPTTALNEDFTFAGSDTGTLKWLLHSDNPESMAITLDDTVDTDDVLLAVYEIEADHQDILVEDIKIDVTAVEAGSGTKISDLVQKFTLCIDGECDWSESGSTAANLTDESHTFNNVDVTLEDGDKAKIEIYADFQPLDGSIILDGDTIMIEIDASDTIAEQASGSNSGDTIVVTGDIDTPAAETHAVFADAPVITLVSSEIVKTLSCDGACATGEKERAEATFTFTVQAVDANVYIPDEYVEDADETDATYGSGSTYFLDEHGGTEPTAVSLSETQDADTSTNGWKVLQGTTKTFVYKVTITAAADGYQSVGMSSIEWSLTDVAGGDALTEDYIYSMQPDWETDSMYLEMTA